jgi:hypothetical protein
MAWPPTLDELKLDAKVDDDRDDARLQLVLDAAVALVERVHRERFTFAGAPGPELPAPPDDLELGTLRLAYRWHVRRRSPDGLVAMGELGSSRVPSFDPDIERLLRLGRYAGPVIA